MLLFVLGLCLAQVSPFPTTSGQCQTIQQAKFTYALLGKEFEKQTVKQAGTMESLNFPNQIDGLKQILFPSQLNDLIIDELKEIMQLLNNVK